MNLEFNKLFAALLVAGITAGTASFVSDLVMHPHALEEDAVPIEGVASVAGPAAGPSGPEPLLHLIATAEVARGEKLSKACAACHSFDKGGINKIGPNLWNAMGAQKGHHSGFAYSEAMTSHGGNWSYEEMNKFLYNPKVYISGTKMAYAGVKKTEDRAAIIAWLRTIGDAPIALPTDAAIEAEKAELAPEPEVSEEETTPQDSAATEGEADADVENDTESENSVENDSDKVEEVSPPSEENDDEETDKSDNAH